MMCDPVKVSAYADGELPAQQAAAAEAHLAGCASCRARLDDIRALSAALRGQAFDVALPSGLDIKIKRAVASAEVPANDWKPRAWLGIGGVAAAVAAVFMILSQPSALVRDLVRNHAAGAPVVALNQPLHPWFQSKLGFSPPVLTKADGCDLVGARLDTAGKKQMSTLSYTCEGHRVDFYAWADPGRDASAPAVTPRAVNSAGYSVVAWKRGRLDCYAVSDLDRPRLLRLARYIEDHAAEG